MSFVASLQRNSKRFDGVIPIKKLLIDSCRSSGPGGQHVNKRNTKVSISFHLNSADWISEDTRAKLADIHKNRISKDGFLTIRSDKTRTQTLNVADCLDRLRAYISEAEQPPEPQLFIDTLEIKRKQLEIAAAERLRDKRIRSTIKNLKSTDNW